MRQPRAQMIAGAVKKTLRLVLQPPERARMNDAGAITLKLRAIRVTRFRIPSPARIAGFLRERGQARAFCRLHLFARLVAAWLGHARRRCSPFSCLCFFVR